MISAQSGQLQIVFNVTDTPVTGTAYPSGGPSSPPVFNGVCVTQSLCMFYRSLFDIVESGVKHQKSINQNKQVYAEC